jgi:hypothetical protein
MERTESAFGKNEAITTDGGRGGLKISKMPVSRTLAFLIEVNQSAVIVYAVARFNSPERAFNRLW